MNDGWTWDSADGKYHDIICIKWYNDYLPKKVLQWLLEKMFLDNTSAAGGASILTYKKQNKTVSHQQRNRSSTLCLLTNKLFRFCFSKTCLVDGFLCLSFLLCWRRIQIKKALICSQILEKLQSLKTSVIRWWWTLLFLKSSETYSAKLTWFWKLKNNRAIMDICSKRMQNFLG